MLRSDASNLFFVDTSKYPAKIASMPKAGGQPQTVLDPGQAVDASPAEIGSFDVRGGTIYACLVYGALNGGEIVSVSTGGGSLVSLAALPADTTACPALAALDSAIYVDVRVKTSGSGISSMPISGGALTLVAKDTLGSATSHPMASDGATAYYLMSTGISQVQVEGVHPGGGAPFTASNVFTPSLGLPELAAASGVVAVVDDNQIVRMFSATAAPLGSFSGQSLAWSVATDGAEVYWSRAFIGTNSPGRFTPQPASIWKGATAGGKPTQLVEGGRNPTSLLVDGGFLYFIDALPAEGGAQGPGLIERMAL